MLRVRIAERSPNASYPANGCEPPVLLLRCVRPFESIPYYYAPSLHAQAQIQQPQPPRPPLGASAAVAMEAARFGAFWRELRTVRSRLCVRCIEHVSIYTDHQPRKTHTRTQCIGGQGEWTRRVVSKPPRGEGGEEEYVVMLHILALPSDGDGAVAAAAAPEPAVGARLAVLGGGMLCWYGGLVHRRNAPQKAVLSPPRSPFISLSTQRWAGAPPPPPLPRPSPRAGAPSQRAAGTRTRTRRAMAVAMAVAVGRGTGCGCSTSTPRRCGTL